MPGENYIPFDQLYKNVAVHNPGLTEDQFREKMSNSDNRFRLWKNLRDHDNKETPSDYKEFVNYYQLDKGKKEAPAPPPQTGTGYPTGVQQNLEADMFEKEQKQKKDLLDKTLLSTGKWMQGPNGLMPKDPHVSYDDQIRNNANEFYEGYLDQKQRDAVPYVNDYYNSKTPLQKSQAEEKIKGIIPDWKPLPPAQYQQLQSAKSDMYINSRLTYGQHEMEAEEADKNVGTMDPKEVAGRLNSFMAARAQTEQEAKDFAHLAYLGGDVNNPTFMQRVLQNFGKSTAEFASFGMDSPDLTSEYNNRAINILRNNGINLQTSAQAKTSVPSATDIAGDLTGQGLGMILPMLVGSYGSEAADLPAVTAKLSSNSNRILAFGGKLLGKSLEQAVPLQMMNWNQSVTKTGEQSGVFSTGDMLMSRIPYKPVNILGKVLFGMAKGMTSGVAFTALEPTVKAGIDAIKGDDTFQKAFNKYSPEAQDYISQSVFMGLMGGFHGITTAPEVKEQIEKEIREKGGKEGTELLDDINKVQPTDNVNKAIGELTKNKPNPNHVLPPVQEREPIVETDNKAFIKFPNKEVKELQQDANGTDKAMVMNFKAGAEPSEIKKNIDDATKRGLIVQKLEVKNSDGDVTGTRLIIARKNHAHLGNEIYALSAKELTQGLSPDEMHTLGALTGADNIKWLEKAKQDASGDPAKQAEYDKIITNIKNKTVEGNGANNEIATMFAKADDMEAKGKPSDAKKIREQTEVVAKKYGYVTHWDKNQLRVETKDGERVGVNKTVKSDNADAIVEAVKGGKIEEAQEIGQKENIAVLPAKDNIHVQDGETTLGKAKYTSIDEAAASDDEADKLINIINSIGKTNSPDFPYKVQIPGMSEEQISKGVQDALYGRPSVEADNVIDAAKNMQFKGVETDKKQWSIDDFTSSLKGKPAGVNSPISLKIETGTKLTTKKGETTFTELKNKLAQPVTKEVPTEQLTAMAKDIAEGKAVNRKAYENINKEYPAELSAELKKLGAESKPVTMTDKAAEPAQKKSKSAKVDYSKGEEVKPEQGMTEEDVSKLVAEKSTSPGEIVKTYLQEQTKAKEAKEGDIKTRSIEEAIGKEGIDQKSYQRFGDRNKVTMSLAKQFFKKGGEKIDTIAKNASYAINPDGQGTDISPEDIVEYMEGKSESGVRTPIMKDLEKRFEEVTGTPLYKPFKGATEQIEEYKNQTAAEQEQLKQYHDDYENHLNQLDEEQLEREASELEKEFTGEVQETPKGEEGKSSGKGEVTAAGISGLLGRNTSILNSLGVRSKVNIEDLPKKSQDIARGFNDTKGEFVSLYNDNNKPELLKSSLADKAAEYAVKEKAAKTEGDKTANGFTASVLQNMSDAINNQADADNIAKIFKGFNKFVYGNKEYYANNLKEIEKLKDFRRPQAPMKRVEIQDLKNNIFSNLDKLMDAQEAKGEKELALGKQDFGLWRGLNRAAFYMQWLHTQSPQEIREKTQQFIHSINEPLTKVVHQNKVKNAGMRLAIDDVLKDKDIDQSKVHKTLVLGDHQLKQYTTDELKEQGLNEKEIGAYHSIRDWLDKNGHEQFKSAYQYYRGYWDLEPDEQKEYLSRWKDYVEKNKGHIPLQRGNGNWAISAFGKSDITGEEGRWFSRHETEKEAKAKAAELEKKGYMGVTDERGEKGMGGGATGEKPRVYYVAPKEEIASDHIRSINDFEQALQRSGLPDKDVKKMQELVDDNSLFLSTEDRETVNKILERNDYAKGLTDQVIDNMNRFKKSQGNPHFLRRSTDINGNVVQGYPEKLEGLMDNIEDFNNRATQNLGRGMFEYRYNKGISQFKGARYKEVYNDLNALHDYVKQGTTSSNGMQWWKNILYFGYLAAKPIQVIRNLLHTVNTVLPDTGNEIDKINIERKQKGLPTVNNWSYLLGAHAIKYQAPITAKIISGKPLPEGIPTSLKKGIEFISSRGGMEHQFTNYINGNEAVTQNWKIRAGFSGFTDLATRVHAAVMAHELGQAKGLKGVELHKYMEDFVDRNKFDWGKYNVPQIQRMFKASGGGLKITAQIASNMIKSPFMLKGFMFQDLGWNRDYIQRAENRPAAVARIAIPRLLVSGGILKTISAFAGIGGAGVEGLYEAIYGHKTDEEMRGQAIKLLGKDLGNDLSDNITYGMMSKLTGTNLQTMMDAGNYIGDSFPLADQIGGAGQGFFKDMGNMASDFANGDYRQLLKDVPFIWLQNVRKAMLYYNMMKENIPVYTGGGSRIVPTGSDVMKKALGFTPLDWTNYYMGQGFKADLVGAKGSVREPEAGSKAGVIQNMIREELEAERQKGDMSKVQEYQHNPTEENFEKAFGSALLKNVNNYNEELFSDYYTAKQSMHASDFKDQVTMLNNVREMAIGITQQDKQWMGESPSNLFIMENINRELEYLKK